MDSNQKLTARLTAAVPRGISIATPLFAARAENAEIWDVEGRRYIDFAGGIAGQSSPRCAINSKPSPTPVSRSLRMKFMCGLLSG
jgi:hypothetical protein